MWQTLKPYIIAIAALLVVGYAAYCYGRNAASDGAGLDAIRSDIRRVIEQQQNIIGRAPRGRVD